MNRATGRERKPFLPGKTIIALWILSKTLCAEFSDSKNAVCSHYKRESADCLKSQRGGENEARDLAMYISRMSRGERLEIVGQEFYLHTYSSVSTAIERTRKKLATHTFRRRYEQIVDSL